MHWGWTSGKWSSHVHKWDYICAVDQMHSKHGTEYLDYSHQANVYEIQFFVQCIPDIDELPYSKCYKLNFLSSPIKESACLLNATQDTG